MQSSSVNCVPYNKACKLKTLQKLTQFSQPLNKICAPCGYFKIENFSGELNNQLVQYSDGTMVYYSTGLLDNNNRVIVRNIEINASNLTHFNLYTHYKSLIPEKIDTAAVYTNVLAFYKNRTMDYKSVIQMALFFQIVLLFEAPLF